MTSSNDIQIGLLAAHELRRFAEMNPTLVADVLSRVNEKSAGVIRTIANINDPGDGTLAEDIGTEESHYFSYDFDHITIICNRLCNDCADLSDKSLRIHAHRYPDAFIDTLDEGKVGAKLSEFLQVDGFDIDTLAPGGIEKVDTKFDPKFSYSVQSIPFAPFRDELLAKISQMKTAA